MPHVTIKMWTGRSDEIKTRLSEKVAQTIADDLGCKLSDVTVAVDDVNKEDWVDQVVSKEIENNPNIYFKK
ncbi:MAG: tautomerase family protein [Clostridia bacterium]|nr:tautomerase family protein [Clostridia bacterium]